MKKREEAFEGFRRTYLDIIYTEDRLFLVGLNQKCQL